MELTLTYKLSEKYTVNTSVIDDASTDSCVEIVGGTRCSVDMHTLITKYGFPTDITRIVTGFKGASAADRISALKLAFEAGHTPSDFLLAALSVQSDIDSVIPTFLFSVGASIYSKEGELSRRVYNTETGDNGTAFNHRINVNTDGRIQLLRHVYQIRHNNDMKVIREMCDITYDDPRYGIRLNVLSRITGMSTEDQDMLVEIIRMCVALKADLSYKVYPNCTHVIAKLIVWHGIAFNGMTINKEVCDLILQLSSQRREIALMTKLEALINKAETALLPLD